MATVGRFNRLKVVNILDFGAFLDGGVLEDILLPKRFVPEGLEIGDELEVFVYLDSDDVPIATTLKPKAQVGDFACLRVTDTNRVGAFMDWNMPKELLVPFNQQKERMVKDQHYTVYIYRDDISYRIVASSKIHKFLNTLTPQTAAHYKNGQEVTMMICDRTDIGYTAIVNNQYLGVIFDQDIDRPLRMGMKFQGFVKRLRPDLKLDLCFKKLGFDKADMSDLGQQIIERLQQSNGFLPLSDRSDAEAIKQAFGVSKRTFKMAIGGLYKARLIQIENDGIHLV